jgi:hypothetical protein
MRYKIIILLLIILASCSPEELEPECQCWKQTYREWTSPFWYDENGTIHITPPNPRLNISSEEVDCQDTYLIQTDTYRFEQVYCINKN